MLLMQRGSSRGTGGDARWTVPGCSTFSFCSPWAWAWQSSYSAQLSLGNTKRSPASDFLNTAGHSFQSLYESGPQRTKPESISQTLASLFLKLQKGCWVALQVLPSPKHRLNLSGTLSSVSCWHVCVHWQEMQKVCQVKNSLVQSSL